MWSSNTKRESESEEGLQERLGAGTLRIRKEEHLEHCTTRLANSLMVKFGVCEKSTDSFEFEILV